MLTKLTKTILAHDVELKVRSEAVARFFIEYSTENMGEPDADGQGEESVTVTCGVLTRSGQMGEPEDLSVSATPNQVEWRANRRQGAIVFLASDASRFMTGADLRIDGGYCVI